MNIPKLAIFNFEPGTDTAITSGVSMQIKQGFDGIANDERATLTTYSRGLRKRTL